MTEVKKLDERFSVRAQVQPEELEGIASLGYRMILNNRPNGEEPDQPDSEEIRLAAEQAGLTYVHQPVVSGNITSQDVEQFEKIMGESDGPVLAFCRSGARCTNLWALSSLSPDSPDETIKRASQAGYDLSSIVPRLKEG